MELSIGSIVAGFILTGDSIERILDPIMEDFTDIDDLDAYPVVVIQGTSIDGPTGARHVERIVQAYRLIGSFATPLGSRSGDGFQAYLFESSASGRRMSIHRYEVQTEPVPMSINALYNLVVFDY